MRRLGCLGPQARRGHVEWRRAAESNHRQGFCTGRTLLGPLRGPQVVGSLATGEGLMEPLRILQLWLFLLAALPKLNLACVSGLGAPEFVFARGRAAALPGATWECHHHWFPQCIWLHPCPRLCISQERVLEAGHLPGPQATSLAAPMPPDSQWGLSCFLLCHFRREPLGSGM